MDVNTIREIILVLVPMLLCLTVHEYAHARSAWYLGDDTASLQGRMTLNPVSHIDIFGTLLLPVLLIMSHSGFFFGWAKPVPVNPVRFNREFNGKRVTMATGMMITAAAGPASNLVFGFFCAILLKVAMVAGIVNESILMILLYLVMVNYGLAIFNMIPIPPLDGSKVLAGLLPRHIARYFDYLEANTLVSFIILIALLRTGVLGKVMGPVFQGMLRTTSALLELPFF